MVAADHFDGDPARSCSRPAATVPQAGYFSDYRALSRC
jgi:hypothetical protein